MRPRVDQRGQERGNAPTPQPNAPRVGPASHKAIRYLSLAQAAEYVGVDAKTIRRMISDGRLTGYRFGGRLIRVALDDLEAQIRPIPSAKAS